MLTPQEITGKEFVKAVFGGYDMSAVDDFLEALTADYSALYKENAILKSKIKVLVEKVEEYRSTEDAMRMALLTAQKMGDELLTEANKKSSEMVTKAEEESRARMAEIEEKLADEKARLAAAQEETKKFIAASQEIIRQHELFLSRIDSIKRPEPVAEPEPDLDAKREEEIVDTARAIDSAVMKIVEEQPSPEPEKSFDDEGEPTRLYRMRTADSNWADDDEPTSPRPKFDFDNLRFGSNYSVDN